MTATIEIQLENYILEEEIGRGNLTAVYRAHRKVDKAIVAIKVANPESTADEVYVRRFKDAAHQAAKLEQPHIARIYEANQEGDILYVAREFIDAPSLAQVIQESGPFAPMRMLMIAKQIAMALDYAHQKSLAHGDLSANRVYIGLNDHVTVADFGQTQAMAGTSLIQKGKAVGAPEIMAPERVKGQGSSRQSDLYSLGILCYQMLVGEPPFKGSAEAVLEAQASEQPRPLHVIDPAIPVALSETIGRMLSKGLELRYNTGAEFTRAMEVAIQGIAPMRAPATAAAQLRAAGLDSAPVWKRLWVWILIGLVAVVFLLVVGFGAVSLWNMRQTDLVVANKPTAVVAPATETPAISAEAPPETVAPLVARVEATETATPLPIPPTETPTPLPTATPTFAPLPTPGPPVVATDSPFTNLVVAHAIDENDRPEQVGTSFAPGSQPIYLFFDYEGIEAGTPWGHRWTWGDTELGAFQDVWPDRYSPSGTAWVFYSPAGGYQPGPYQVTLEINGRTVATATFVVQPGGL